MDKHRINIAIVDSSLIIYEGLSTILLQENRAQYRIFHFDSLEEVMMEMPSNRMDIMIINPLLVKNDLKFFHRIKNGSCFSVKKPIMCVGIIYSFFDRETLALFDDLIMITDQPTAIIEIINKLAISTYTYDKLYIKEQLSQRETEVLQQLAQGLSNKEIADKLNISIHTVISHRKNIIQKTGIRSQAGLTIYAITNKIINIDNLE